MNPTRLGRKKTFISRLFGSNKGQHPDTPSGPICKDQHSYTSKEIPLEIWTEILMGLDLSDLLRARQTCRDIYHASKANSIWACLIAHHESAVPRPFTILEKPVDFYVKGELEERFLLWKKLEYSWKRGFTPNTPTVVSIHSPRFRACHILRGGRWLLCSERYRGEVFYLDLYSTDHPRTISLIPPADECRSFMAIDEDWDAPFLTFTVAIAYFAEGGRATGQQSRIDVWRGSLTMDEENRSTGLRAERLASITLTKGSTGDPLGSMSLLGSFVAFDTVFSHGGTYVVILNWKDTRAHSGCLSKIIRCHDRDNISVSSTIGLRHSQQSALLTQRQSYFQLLPDNRIILLKNRRTIAVYDHAKIPLDTIRPGVGDLPYLARTMIQFLDLHPNFSRAFTFRDGLRIIFFDTRGIYGISLVEELGKLEVHVALMLEWPPDFISPLACSADFSHNHGVAFHVEHAHFILAQFNWPGEDRIEKPGFTMWRSGHYVPTECAVKMDISTGKVAYIDVGGVLYVSTIS